MKLALLFAVVPLASFAGVPSWRVVNSGTREPLWGVAVLDHSTAVAVGWNGTILRSEDRGESWTLQEGGTDFFLFAVSFGDSLHGTAVGGYGVILRTEDGGFTWTPQDSRTAQHLFGVHFADALIGTAVGDRIILRTEDGGETWQAQSMPPDGYYYLRAVFFTDAENGTVVGYHLSGFPPPSSAILTTGDGGATWEVRGPLQRPLYGVAFSDKMRGTAVGGISGFGSSAVVMRTVDGGTTWHTQLYVDDRIFDSVAYAGDVGAIVGGPTTLWTWDGGNSWTRTEGRTFSSLAFFDADRAIGVGGLGRIALSKQPPGD